MTDILAQTYVLITLAVFVIALCTSTLSYGRGVEPGPDWEFSFFFAVVWPLFVVLLIFAAIQLFKNEPTQ